MDNNFLKSQLEILSKEVEKSNDTNKSLRTCSRKSSRNVNRNRYAKSKCNTPKFSLVFIYIIGSKRVTNTHPGAILHTTDPRQSSLINYNIDTLLTTHPQRSFRSRLPYTHNHLRPMRHHPTPNINFHTWNDFKNKVSHKAQQVYMK